MQLKTHKLFVELCETFLPEASTSLDLVRAQPGGQAVIQQLHKASGLSHDQSYGPVPKISWSDLKDSYKGAWVIIQGAGGVGAIRAKNGTYDAFASTGDQVKEFSDSRGGNVLNFLKTEIGNLQKFYVGKNTSAVQDKRSNRKERNAVPNSQQVNQSSLVKKFRPLWSKAMTSAIADIKGMVSTMIKNDAFEKAEKKIALLKSLEKGVEQVESGSDDVPEFVTRSVGSAIMMTAAHYYPEDTGEIQRPRYGSGSYTSERPEGPQKLLSDISNGDTKKLGTILAFFKRSLISG